MCAYRGCGYLGFYVGVQVVYLCAEGEVSVPKGCLHSIVVVRRVVAPTPFVIIIIFINVL